MSSKSDRFRRRNLELERQRAAERRKDRISIFAAIAVFVLIVGGAVVFVATKGSRTAGTPSVTPAATALPPPPSGSVPPQIAANIAEASRVVEGSVTAKLKALRGVPVVVNQWASWCPNCKAEFPFFQRESSRYERQVAFLGLDAQDQRPEAVSFLHRFPVDYPSIFDESAAQSASLGGGQGWPTTFFFDHTGKETFLHQGAYPSQEQLDADIHRYALGA
jgi:thiol-disulfide isomerase/thioredoxin